MAHHAGGDEATRLRKARQRTSKNVDDHIGYITLLVVEWKRRGFFVNATEPEIRSIAYIEADRLLREKYDEQKATVTTFLRKYLLGRIDYYYRTGVLGQKKWDGRFINPAPTQREKIAPSPVDHCIFEEVIEGLHPDFRAMARRIANGDDLAEVASENEMTEIQLRSILKNQLSSLFGT